MRFGSEWPVFILFCNMDEVIAKISNSSGFSVCEAASPPGADPVPFPLSMKVTEIRAVLNAALKEISEKFKGKKTIQRIQREEQMRTRFVRVGRLHGTSMHVFLFLRNPDGEDVNSRYGIVPLSLLPPFHKTFKLPHVTASVEERGEDAFRLRPTQTADGFQYPVADARLWLQRYQKSQGITTKRPAEERPDQRPGRTLKKMKASDGGESPSLFTPKSAEEYARLKKRAVEMGLRVLADAKGHDLVDLADLEDDDSPAAESDSFEVIPGAQLGDEARPLCAEDFSAFRQPPQTNYFIGMAAGLDPGRAKAMAKSKVRWQPGASMWSPSTLMSIMARSAPRTRNFDAMIMSVLKNSSVAAGLNISAELSSEVPRQGMGESRDDEDIMSEDLFEEDGTINDEGLLLKHNKTLEELQEAILQLALEPYKAMLFSLK